MKCCFCDNTIATHHGWDKGNNANPVMDGRCCDTCNETIVIPTRINHVTSRRLHLEAEAKIKAAFAGTHKMVRDEKVRARKDPEGRRAGDLP